MTDTLDRPGEGRDTDGGTNRAPGSVPPEPARNVPLAGALSPRPVSELSEYERAAIEGEDYEPVACQECGVPGHFSCRH